MAPETAGKVTTAHPPTGLLQGTDQLGTFLSLMPDAAIAVDSDGTIVAVNERTETFFGYPPGELEGKPIAVLVPERSRHSHREKQSAFSCDPRARPMGAGLDLYARRRDGSEFPVDISLAPIGPEKAPLVVAAVRDITERKAAQSAQAQLAAIVRSSADGIFSMTRDGVITSWNPSAAALFGYNDAEVVGHHISRFFPDDPVFEDLLDAARSGRTTRSRDTRWQTHSGATIDVAISVSLLDPNDQAGYSVLVRDVTVRKGAEELMRRQASWQEATAEIRLSLLSDASLETSLTLVCKWAVELAGASAVALVATEDRQSHIAAKAGDHKTLTTVVRRLKTVAALVENGTVNLGADLVATTLPFSLPGSSRTRAGALVVVSHLGSPLQPSSDEVLASLASQAILSFELADVRSERDRLLISADRERIARDLHDLVIQRLFGAGLRLQGALSLIDNQAASARVSSTIDDLDMTIKEIREAIFALEAAPGTGLRAKVLEAVADAVEALGFQPVVSFHGSADRDVPQQIRLEAAAILREALSNSARHAHATRVEVHVTVDDELDVLVVDNGVGIGDTNRFSGLANARARAVLLGGHLELSPADGDGRGTSFDWRVPLATIADDGA
jgi:PAS domain S-box-containing protein